MATVMTVSALPAVTSHLRRLESGLVVPATTGNCTFVTEREKFIGYFDRDFETYGTNVPSGPTQDVMSDLFETNGKSGDFRAILNSLFLDLDQVFWKSQNQILAWIGKYPHHLHPQRAATFIPFMVGSKRFVTRIRFCDRGLRANIRYFSEDYIWDANDHIRWVLPQPQTTP